MASTLDIHDSAPDDKNEELELKVHRDHDENDDKTTRLDEEDIYFENDENEISSNDKPAMYSVKLFENWCLKNGHKIDLKTASPKAINQLLLNFYPDVRNKTGDPYSYSTLCLFRYGLNRYFQKELVREGRSKIDIIEGPEFKQANSVFRQVVKVMKEHNPVHEAQIITPEHIRRIYASYAFSLQDAKCLLYKVWFEITVFFGKPKHDQQRLLRKDDFIIDTDENGCRYVTKVTKKEVDGENKVFPRMYEKKGDPQCPVTSFEKYLSKLSKAYIYLFQRPKDKTPVNPHQPWYMPMSPGKNFMFRMMSRISKLANLDTIFTNSVLKKLHRGLLIDMFLHRHDMIQLSKSGVSLDGGDKQNATNPKDESSVLLGAYRPILPADAKESVQSSKNVSGSLHQKLQLVRMCPSKQTEEGAVLETENKQPGTKCGVEEAKAKIKLIFQELDYPDLVCLDAWLKKVEVLKDTSGKVICRDPTPVVNITVTQKADVLSEPDLSPPDNELPNNDSSQKNDSTLNGNLHPKGDSPPDGDPENPNKDDTVAKYSHTQKGPVVSKGKASRRSDSGPKGDVTAQKGDSTSQKGDSTSQKGDPAPKSGVKRKHDPLLKRDGTTKTDQALVKTFGKKRQETVVMYPNFIDKNQKRANSRTHSAPATSARKKIAPSAAMFSPASELPMNPAPVVGAIEASNILSSSTKYGTSTEPSNTAPDTPISDDIQVKVEPEFTAIAATTASKVFSTHVPVDPVTSVAKVTSNMDMVPPQSNPPAWFIPEMPPPQVQHIKPERDIFSLSVINPSSFLMQSVPRIPVNITDSTLAHRRVQFPHPGSYYLKNTDVKLTGNTGTVGPGEIHTVPPAVNAVRVISSGSAFGSPMSAFGSPTSAFGSSGSSFVSGGSSFESSGLSFRSSGSVVSVGSIASVVPIMNTESIYIPQSQTLNQSLANALGVNTMKSNPNVILTVNADDKMTSGLSKSADDSAGAAQPRVGPSRKKKCRIINMTSKNQLLM